MPQPDPRFWAVPAESANPSAHTRRRSEAARGPVRVLHFLPWLAGGGVETALLDLIRGLPSGRYLHHVACFSTKGPRRDDFDRLGIPVTVLGGSGRVTDVRGMVRLTRLARQCRPDVLHGCVFEGQVIGTIAGRAARVPVVISEETTCPAPPGDRSLATRLLLRQILLRDDAVVAISPAVGRYLVHTNHVPSRLVRVIHYGVQRPRHPAAEELASERASLGLPAGSVVIGTVCRLHDRHKRVSDLILAFSSLASELPELRLLIVGDGPDRSMLAGLATQCGVADRVHFAGYHADPAPYYHLMDIFALPSAFEGFGRVFVEAAWCGLPCIGTSVGGITDAIDHEVTGLLVPPSDPTTLAGALRRLVTDARRRRSMGEAGRRRAEHLHSVEGYARAFDTLFHATLGRV